MQLLSEAAWSAQQRSGTQPVEARAGSARSRRSREYVHKDGRP